MFTALKSPDVPTPVSLEPRCSSGKLPGELSAVAANNRIRRIAADSLLPRIQVTPIFDIVTVTGAEIPKLSSLNIPSGNGHPDASTDGRFSIGYKSFVRICYESDHISKKSGNIRHNDRNRYRG